MLQRVREVAQPGSALVWGARGRKFESCLPDFVFTKPATVLSLRVFVFNR